VQSTVFILTVTTNMKQITAIILFITLLSCQEKENVNEKIFTNTFQITQSTIGFFQNELLRAKLENPEKTQKWYQIGLNINKITSTFYSLDSIGFDSIDINDSYISTRQKLQEIAKNHNCYLSDNKQIDHINSSESYFLAALDIRLIESQLLNFLVVHISAPRCGYQLIDIRTRGSQVKNLYKMQLVSGIFQKSELNHVVIDSILRDGVVYNPDVSSKADSSFWDITFKNLEQGEYQVYGKSIGLRHSGNPKIEDNFEHTFEINNTGGNNK
jgi:hypothetical protein